MRRRDFLLGAAAGIATGVAATRPAFGQGRGGAPIPHLGNPTPYPKTPKTDRIAFMTLNFANWINLPDVQPGPQRTMNLFDVPAMFADVYGVHLIEFSSWHFESQTPAYFKSLREVLAKSRSRTSQVDVAADFGPLHMSAPTASARSQSVILTKAWIDIAASLGARRVMVNQGPDRLSRSNLPQAIEAFKAMSDYGKSKKVVVCIETRLQPQTAGRGSGAVSAAPPPSGLPKPGLETWQLEADLINGAGAYSNPDVGNCNATNQEELHRALSKDLLYPTAGAMHCRVSTAWDLTTALKYVTGLGFRGTYTVESNLGHEGVKPIYEAVLAAL